MVWTHHHRCCNDDILWLHKSGNEILPPLLALALQDITPVLGRPDHGGQGIVDGRGWTSEAQSTIVHPQPALSRGQ
jgi:hypothetical protein